MDIYELFETKYENIYKETENDIGIGEGEFKARYNNHKKLFSRPFKFIWNLKD